MSFTRDSKHPNKIRNVTGVQLSVIGPDEIKNRSVVNVTETILYDNSGEPVINGLFDPRMGVIDHGKICPTDELDNKFCPGYFGHIELAKPVYHIQFMDIIFSLVKTVCIKCSKVLHNVHEDREHIEKLDN